MRGVDKPIVEKTRGEIERKISGMGDFVVMSYLQRALQSKLDFDTKKFVFLRLAGIYENKKMFLDAAKLVKNAGEINVTYREKIRDYLKSVELNIKGGNFNEADRIFTQAMALGSVREKGEMKFQLKNFYLTQAKLLLGQEKRNHAKKIYEKVLSLELDIGERNDVHKTLLDLYKRLGDIREYYVLKEKLS
jgi:tetratricopeptide (TPR) repeat protein